MWKCQIFRGSNLSNVNNFGFGFLVGHFTLSSLLYDNLSLTIKKTITRSTKWKLQLQPFLHCIKGAICKMLGLIPRWSNPPTLEFLGRQIYINIYICMCGLATLLQHQFLQTGNETQQSTILHTALLINNMNKLKSEESTILAHYLTSCLLTQFLWLSSWRPLWPQLAITASASWFALLHEWAVSLWLRCGLHNVHCGKRFP